LKVALHYGKVLGSRAKDAVAKAERPRLKIVESAEADGSKEAI
jgi:hypothetical protein